MLMEIKNDKFIEYCKGKLFIPVWKNSDGIEVRDRWITFEEDAVTSFNYLRSVFNSEDIIRCSDFTGYIKELPYSACFVTNEQTTETEISFLFESREEVECHRGTYLFDRVVEHIKKQIGELDGD
jgi:hypothetical protein